MSLHLNYVNNNFYTFYHCLIYFSNGHKYSHSCITSLISDTSNSLLGIKLAKLPAVICFLLSEFVHDNASSPSCLTRCLADVKGQEFAFKN